jgi:hypothetical protein
MRWRFISSFPPCWSRPALPSQGPACQQLESEKAASEALVFTILKPAQKFLAFSAKRPPFAAFLALQQP